MEAAEATGERGGYCEASEVGERLLSLFRRYLSEAELYLDPKDRLRANCLTAVEQLFQCLRQSGEDHVPLGPLKELYTSGFDEDQVWEELQLANDPGILWLNGMVRKIVASGNFRLLAGDEVAKEGEGGEEEGEGEEEEEEEENEEELEKEEEEEEELDKEEKQVQAGGRSGDKSEVDDSFFSLSAMEQYLEVAEQLSDPGSEGSVGALAEELSESESSQLLYQDFFDPPQKSSPEQEKLSSYERRKKKMARQINAIEGDNMRPKSWQMSGEARSRDRPLNSLLEETVDFEPMTAPAPVVSEETTHSLEDIIRQRILDQAWDDVQRKVKPVEKPYDYQRSRPLDQERSKRSLAEVYEEEYVQQTTQEGQSSSEGVREEHQEIETLRNRLFLKLDALSNFHFTPKPLVSEPQVVSNVSAVEMEEALPSSVAQHTLLAPEEVQPKSRVPVKGESEKSSADKRRQRGAKKRLKRSRGTKQSLKRPVKIRSHDTSQKTSSRQFFASLQQTQSQ